MTLLLALALAAFAQAATVETVARDSMSGIEEPRQVAIQSSDEWSKLWREHAGNKAEPRVDFTSRTVLAVFLGTRSSAGYGVEITGTRAEGNGLVVLWREHRPAAGVMTAQVLTSPAHLVTVPKVAGPITFEKAGQ
jgi:hypothetical protein